MRTIAENASRLSLFIHAMTASWLAGDTDPELATRVGSLIDKLRQSLVTLGLGQVARDVQTLEVERVRRSSNGTEPSRLRRDRRGERNQRGGGRAAMNSILRSWDAPPPAPLSLEQRVERLEELARRSGSLPPLERIF